MLACTAEKQRRVFINMNKLSLLFIVVASISCGKNNINQDPIDDVAVNVVVNLGLSSNSYMLNPGNHMFVDGGVKGIVIVHHTDDTYYAFDRNCSYQPKTACSKIEVDSAVFIFRCGESTSSGFVKCCDSKFLMNGDVFNGPATYGLKRYRVQLDGNILYIKN